LRLVSFGALFVFAPCPAGAQENLPLIFAERRNEDSTRPGPTFMITPWAGFVSGGSFQNSANNDVLYVNDSAGFGFILDLLDTPRAYYELLYSFQRTDLGGIDTPGWPSHLDLDIHYLQIGGMYEFPRERTRPFIAGGIGLTAIVPDGRDSSTNLSFSLGGGVQIPLSARFALRIEGRGMLTVISDNTEIFCASSGAGGGCAVGVEGDSLAQFEVLAGLSFGL
jgi:opacity protein-like surface antigen